MRSVVVGFRVHNSGLCQRALEPCITVTRFLSSTLLSFLFLGSPIKTISRKKGTLTIMGLLRNLGNPSSEIVAQAPPK